MAVGEADGKARADTRFMVPGLPVSGAAAPGEAGDEGPLAPLIFNAWYVIARSEDVGRELGSIRALGQPLVYFRMQDGRPVVLDDRCSHRRFALSKGKLVGDAVQCGYHGFTYGASGQCIWAPGVPVDERGEVRLRFGVRAYPCAERGPWLWVWMGDPELADPGRIPLPDDLLDNPESTICGYLLNPANYMMMIENLLDLSHLHFLHGAADLEHVAVPPREMAAPADGVAWSKAVESTTVGLIGAQHGCDPDRLCSFEEQAIQHGPSLTFGMQMRKALPGDDAPVHPEQLQIVHAITPLDERNTHQFFMLVTSAPFAMDRAEMLAIVRDVVFEQDVAALQDIQAAVESDDRSGRVEFSMPYDNFGLRMRRILREMKEREASAG